MKKATDNRIGAFPVDLVKSWEASDGVNFAIALARITGWLLHVDWFTTNEGKEPVEEMKSLRVYVGDDHHNVFDIRGKMKITSFCMNIITPILKERAKGKGGVLTRFYSEEKLMSLPLRVKPDIDRIAQAEGLIRSNQVFLEKIPVRKAPFIPAHRAANFTFGRCAVYATVLHEITNLPVVAVIANKYTEQFGHSEKGYTHSMVIHPDGEGEDAWGKQPIEHIVSRYGVDKYIIDEAEHWRVNENLKKNSPEEYEKTYNDARDLINTFVEKKIEAK